jgi:hypothetical protein
MIYHDPDKPMELLINNGGRAHAITLATDEYIGADPSHVTQRDTKAEIMAELNALSLTLEPLPLEGGTCQDATYYDDNGKTVYCRQYHIRTSHDVSEVPALFYYTRANEPGLEWMEQESVSVGWMRDWLGITYECLQEHVTLEGWEPPNVPALWAVPPVGNVWQAGVAVTINQQYWYPTDQDTLYRVLQAHTTQVGWEPPNVPALWEVV